MGEEISGLLRPPAIPQQYLNPSYQADIAYDSGTYVGSQAAAFPYLIEEPTFPQATGVAPPGYGRREPDRLNNVYRKQQRLLRETNTNTSLGRVVEGADSLIEMSRLVLGNVESLGMLNAKRCFSAYILFYLGLTKDNEDLHKVRLEFWKEFNHSWLAFLTRQLQDSRTRRESGQPLSGGQTVLSKDRVKALGDELKSLNDDLQHTGLIDYEMGVWEKEISDGKQIIVIWMSNMLTYHSIDSMLEYLGRRGAFLTSERYLQP